MIKVLHHVSIMDRGGQETFIMNVFRNIDKSQFGFDFLCSLNGVGAFDDEIRELGGQIYYLNLTKNGNKITKYFYYYRDKVKALKQYADKYDIVHLHNYHAFSSFIDVVAFRKAGFKKIILHSHNSSAPREKLHKFFKIFLNLDKKINRFACSDIAGEWLHGKNKYEVIYNGIETDKYKFDQNVREKIRKEMNIENKLVVGHVGRFNYQKNHTFLLDIFKKLCDRNPNSVLLLVGKGELEREIKDKVKELNLSDKVIFLGVREDIAQLMCAFDVLLFPSLFEGLGIVLVESQYCKLPCVISNNLTNQVIFSNLVSTLSLKDTLDNWVTACQNSMSVDRERATLTNNKFDIHLVTEVIAKKYKSIVGENSKTDI